MEICSVCLRPTCTGQGSSGYCGSVFRLSGVWDDLPWYKLQHKGSGLVYPTPWPFEVVTPKPQTPKPKMQRPCFQHGSAGGKSLQLSLPCRLPERLEGCGKHRANPNSTPSASCPKEPNSGMNRPQGLGFHTGLRVCSSEAHELQSPICGRPFKPLVPNLNPKP